MTTKPAFEQSCWCKACLALKAEGGSHFPWLHRKLLVRGWAGRTSAAERAYIRAHASWAKKRPPTVQQMAARKAFTEAHATSQSHPTAEPSPPQTPSKP